MNIRFVYVKERAFFAMVLSSVEVYKHETLGLLLGYVGEDRFVVEYAIPFQTAIKGYTWVQPKPKYSDRMKKILKDMPITVIGDFHSHTQWKDWRAKATLSGEDIADMDEGKVYIIIAVNEKVENISWSHKEDGKIIGTLADFEIEIGAYVLVCKYKTQPIKIICPSATGLKYGEI